VYTWSWIAIKSSFWNKPMDNILLRSCTEVFCLQLFNRGNRTIKILYQCLWCSGITLTKVKWFPYEKPSQSARVMTLNTGLYSNTQTVSYFTKDYYWIPATYSGTLLIQSPTSHENLAIVTGSNFMIGLN